jgi:hypothetical protein
VSSSAAEVRSDSASPAAKLQQLWIISRALSGMTTRSPAMATMEPAEAATPSMMIVFFP